MQHLLARASWDTDGVRDDLRDYVAAHLGDADAVLVVDETGDVKKGTAHRRGAAPVHRHRRADRERPGGGLPHLRRPRGHAMIDRELYLPRPGPAIPPLRRGRSPDDVEFATKPALAPGCSPGRWTPGSRPGGSPATRSTAPTRPARRAGSTAGRLRAGHRLRPARPHRRGAAPRRRDRRSCPNGPGSGSRPGRRKGHRFYDWAWITLLHRRAPTRGRHGRAGGC